VFEPQSKLDEMFLAVLAKNRRVRAEEEAEDAKLIQALAESEVCLSPSFVRVFPNVLLVCV
jgi:hypothetical protein